MFFRLSKAIRKRKISSVSEANFISPHLTGQSKAFSKEMTAISFFKNTDLKFFQETRITRVFLFNVDAIFDRIRIEFCV